MIMKNLRFLSMALLAAFSFALSSCGSDDDPAPSPTGPRDMQSTLAGSAQFSLLSEALEKTGLDAALRASGSLTLFAPNDEAFRSLLSDLEYQDLDELINDLGPESLQNILLYHLLPERRASSEISTAYYRSMSTTADGDSLSMFINAEGGLNINMSGSSLVRGNVQASNGLIHEIDRVLLPQSIWALISANPEYGSLVSALMLADGDLDEFLDDANERFTLFAPDDTAFENIVAAVPGVSTLTQLVALLGTDQLAEVLKYHLLAGVVMAGDLSNGNRNTLGSDGSSNYSFFVNITSTGVRIIDNSVLSADANVVATNIVGTNGVMHEIDAVLLPE